MAGPGVSTKHQKRDEQENRSVATVAYEYCFLRNAVGDDYVPVLVMKDWDSKMLFAHVVPCKGRIQSGLLSKPFVTLSE